VALPPFIIPFQPLFYILKQPSNKLLAVCPVVKKIRRGIEYANIEVLSGFPNRNRHLVDWTTSLGGMATEC